MMAQKKTITTSDIISLYMEYVLEHNKQPETVFHFAKTNNFEEIKFYEHFTSFEALEQSVFKEFFDNAYSILENSSDYQSYDYRNKLLSFYYTFFEVLTKNRSFVIYTLKNQKDYLKKLRSLSKLKQRFTLYIKHLNIPYLKIDQDKIEKIQINSVMESAWLQLLFTMKFWLEDTSPSFEKTDIFIEKAVNTSFDLIDAKPLKSILDFGKFLYKEKIQMN